MKKLIPLLVLAVSAVTGSSQVVNFNNNVLTEPPDRTVYDADRTTPLTGTHYRAVLLYGATDSSLTAHTQTANFRVATSLSAGTWQGGSRTLTGFNEGQTIRMAVAVFDSRQFASYAAALAGNGILGQSTPFAYVIPTSPIAAGADSMVNFGSFSLVPEPSVIGLAMVGAGALFLLRRRK